MESLAHRTKLYQASKHVENKLHLADQIVTEIAPKLSLFFSQRCPAGEVDDLRQEVLIAVANELDACRADHESQFWSWVFRIARNKLATRLEKLSRLITVDDVELGRLIEDWGEGEPVTRRERDELDMLWGLLWSLPERQRLGLELRFFQNLSHEEVAETLGGTADANRMAITRTLKELKDRLKGTT